jgi:hypothetical protein
VTAPGCWATAASVVLRLAARPGGLYAGPPSPPLMRAVQITRFGGPEVLEIVDLPEPAPAAGPDALRVSTAGINYADNHHHLDR